MKIRELEFNDSGEAFGSYEAKYLIDDNLHLYISGWYHNFYYDYQDAVDAANQHVRESIEEWLV